MKNFLRIGAIALLILFNTISCGKRGLDTTSTNTYNETNFWQSEEQATAALNGCYKVLTNGGLFDPSGSYLRTENYTPNAYTHGGNIPLSLGTQTASNVSLFEDRWNAAYKGIGRVNNLLAHINSIDINQNTKDRMKGEAYFLRALFYETLVDYYGGVPLILKAPNIEESNIPRNSRGEVVKQMIKDLDEAATLLPYSYSGSNVGRATKGAALALKARVLLYNASALFNPSNDKSRWKKAAAAAKKVMDIAPEAAYGLFPDYRGLFMKTNENNKEVIFDVQYKAPQVVHHSARILELQQNVVPLPDLVNSYLMKDGQNIQNSPLYDPSKPYENRDPRLLETIGVPGYMFMGEKVPVGKYFSTGYGFKKYTNYKDDEKPPNGRIQNSELNLIIVRYADVLLMYAEARNEAEGPDASVYEALNKIRDRVDMPHIPTGLSKEKMREVIRHERRIELAGEGLYYNDIRRWRIAEKVRKGPVYNRKGVVIQRRSFDEKDYLWPIAAVVLQENPALEQNPGYQ